MNIQERLFNDLEDNESLQLAHRFSQDYLENVFDREVFPKEESIKNLERFEEDFPEEVGDAIEAIKMLHEYGSPATVASMGGRYFGFVTGSTTPVGLAAKTLTSSWDQLSAMYVSSPVTAQLEVVAEKWLNDIFGLGDAACGFVSGTSAANLCGLAAARYQQLQSQGWDVTKKGLLGSPTLRIIISDQAHSTVVKALSILGFGEENLEKVQTDDQGRIIPDHLPEMDNSCILVLQAGNVNTGSFDNFSEVMKSVSDSGCWVHVDGAFGLWAQASSNLAHLTKGMELADSWAVDGHKTLNTPYDSGIIMCKHKTALVNALHISGSYIIESKIRDGMFYTPEMSRRSRVIELWATLKYLGRKGLDEMIEIMHNRAVQFSKEIGAIDGFEVVNDVVFNQVLIQCNTDELTTNTLKNIQKLRECWVGGSIWKYRNVIHVSVCSWATTKKDISRSVASFRMANEIALKNQVL